MTDAEWCHASWYVIYPVALLPHLERDSFGYAEPERSNMCMRRGMPLGERLGRQVVRMRPRDCCYYHSVDWRRVAAEARRIAHDIPLAAQSPPWWSADDSDEAEQAYERAWQPHNDARDLATACDLPEREREAVEELQGSGGYRLSATTAAAKPRIAHLDVATCLRVRCQRRTSRAVNCRRGYKRTPAMAIASHGGGALAYARNVPHRGTTRTSPSSARIRSVRVTVALLTS